MSSLLQILGALDRRLSGNAAQNATYALIMSLIQVKNGSLAVKWGTEELGTRVTCWRGYPPAKFVIVSLEEDGSCTLNWRNWTANRHLNVDEIRSTFISALEATD